MVSSMKSSMDFFLQGIKLHTRQLLQVFFLLIHIMTVSVFMIQMKQLLELLLRTLSSLLSSQVQSMMVREPQLSVCIIIISIHISFDLISSCNWLFSYISLDVSNATQMYLTLQELRIFLPASADWFCCTNMI